MAIEIGNIYEGRVTGIMKFGAFVALPEGKSGLVHISEVANAFVSDINEFLQVGQTTQVKVLAISPEGKINLSIKKALPQPTERTPYPPKPSTPREPREQSSRPAPRPSAPAYAEPKAANGPSDDKDFESRLKKFMQESDSRIADNPRYADRPRKNRRR